MLALAISPTIDGANDARSEPPGVMRVGDVPWLAWRVDRAIDLEAWRTAKGLAPLH